MNSPLESREIDGFITNCTSNQDSTGICVNQETSKSYNCLIIPGQVIECNSLSDKSFQCVSISGTIGNQAQFWCDPSVDSMLSKEIDTNEFSPDHDNKFSPAINHSKINSTETVLSENQIIPPQYLYQVINSIEVYENIHMN
jgi:hypothetical protein